jgi:UDP-N-acetylglucosamine transferase subunit ALG13
MIFVVLGTWEAPFTRPLVEIEQVARDGLLDQPIVVQSGATSYQSTKLQLVPYFDKDELERMYEQAQFIIAQAGVGSIMLGLRKGKKVISVARRAQYDEHIDDHQLEILDVFSKSNYVLPWNAAGDLPQVLRRLADFAPAAYDFKQEQLSDAILAYLAMSKGAR